VGDCTLYKEETSGEPGQPATTKMAEFTLKQNQIVDAEELVWEEYEGTFVPDGPSSNLCVSYQVSGLTLPGLGLIQLVGLEYRKKIGSFALSFGAAYGWGDGFDKGSPEDKTDGLEYSVGLLNLEAKLMGIIDLAAVDIMLGGLAGSKLIFQSENTEQHLGASILLGALTGLSLKVFHPVTLDFVFGVDLDIYVLDHEWTLAFSPRGGATIGLSF